MPRVSCNVFFVFDMERIFDEELVVKAAYDNFFLDDIFNQKEYRGIYAEMMNPRKKSTR